MPGLAGTKEIKFDFTHVYGQQSTQMEVFRDSEPLMTSVTDGYNVCIFTYGQSGTGKTYTMDGTDAEPGICPRAMNRLFEVMDENVQSGNCRHECHMSMLEIYNENIRDLLADPREDPTKRKCDQHPHLCPVSGLLSICPHLCRTVYRSRYEILPDAVLGMHVKNLSSFPVRSAKDARALIKQGRTP